MLRSLARSKRRFLNVIYRSPIPARTDDDGLRVTSGAVLLRARFVRMASIGLLGLIVVSGLILLAREALGSNPQEPILGTVNGEPITAERFEHEIRLQQLRNDLSGHPGLAVDQARVLNRLVGDFLMLQAAAEQQVTVSRMEVEAETADLLRRTNKTREQFEALLADHQLAWEDLNRSIHEYLAILRFQNEILLKDVPAQGRAAAFDEWITDRYAAADIRFDQQFLDEVNAGALPDPAP